MYACKEHIDYVMEDFIDEYQVAPTLELVTNQEARCAWCQQAAHYELLPEQEDTSLAD